MSTLRVWWMPQVPGKPFHVDVDNIVEGVKLMNTLADYDQFQLDNTPKLFDFCNMGGLQMFDTADTTDGPNGSWVNWCDEETGEDDPKVYLSDFTFSVGKENYIKMLVDWDNG